METTKLIVEYLVAGILTLAALLLATLSFFPLELQAASTSFRVLQPTLAIQALLSISFLAAAYGAGVLAEYIGRIMFEGELDNIKQKRMQRFLTNNRNHLRQSPLLQPFLKVETAQLDIQALTACIGKMRFHVLHNSPNLYAEIESQINRFRLIRVLFLVEIIIVIAVLRQLARGVSLLLILVLAITIILAYINFQAVRSRFDRYCRSVERAYLTLLIHEPTAGYIEPTQKRATTDRADN